MCLGLDKKPYISTLGDSTWIAYAENQGLSQLHYNRCVDLLYTDNGWKIFKCCIELNLAVQLNETAQQSFWCVRDKLIFFTIDQDILLLLYFTSLSLLPYFVNRKRTEMKARWFLLVLVCLWNFNSVGFKKKSISFISNTDLLAARYGYAAQGA